MTKEKVQPFTSVKAFLEVQAAADKANGLLNANQKYFEKRFGENGGSIKVDDGKLTLTKKEKNGKESTAYAKALETLENFIQSGKLHQMSLKDACKWLIKNRAHHTNPQFSSQKVEATLNKDVESSTDHIVSLLSF